MANGLVSVRHLRRPLHDNPLTGSRGESGLNGDYVTTMEADPLGVNVGKEDPAIDPEPNGFSPDPDMPMLGGIGGSGCSSSNPYCKKCHLDGARVECMQVSFLWEHKSKLTRSPDTFSSRSQQNPEIIMVPISIDRLKELIQSTLKHGDCAGYVAKLINKAVEIPNNGGQIQPIESTNIMEFFEKIRSQPTGSVLSQPISVPHPN